MGHKGDMVLVFNEFKSCWVQSDREFNNRGSMGNHGRVTNPDQVDQKASRRKEHHMQRLYSTRVPHSETMYGVGWTVRDGDRDMHRSLLWYAEMYRLYPGNKGVPPKSLKEQRDVLRYTFYGNSANWNVRKNQMTETKRKNNQLESVRSPCQR